MKTIAPFPLLPTRIDSSRLICPHSNASERPATQLICDTNATKKVDVEARI